MELTFECPGCQGVGTVSPVEQVAEATCPHCGLVHPLHSESFDQAGLKRCAWCATDDLYIQKDFPQALGLLIVIVGFVIATVFWYYVMPLSTYAVLMASALLDLILYYHVPDVTICYRCLGQYRGAGSNPNARFAPFDLGIGERYRQERLRIEQLRQH